MNLSPHFTLKEMTRSEIATRWGLDNTPSGRSLVRLQNTARRMESVRALLGVPIYVQSGFRSAVVNQAVGGSHSSAHMRGDACDFEAPDFGTPLEVCRKILDSEIEFDQLIAEGVDRSGGGWVHIAFSDKPRRSVLTAHFNNGRVSYTQGIS